MISEVKLVKLPDGREFPQHNGETLSWSLGLYHTISEEQQGFPKMYAVARAMHAYRPDQLQRERFEMLKGSFDRMFGHNAKKELKVIEEVLAEAKSV
jgi:hypothetical protein